MASIDTHLKYADQVEWVLGVGARPLLPGMEVQETTVDASRRIIGVRVRRGTHRG